MSDHEKVAAAASLGATMGCIAKALITEMSAPILAVHASPAASLGFSFGAVFVKTGAPVLLVAKTAAGTAALFAGAGLSGAIVAGGIAYALLKGLK